MKAKDRLSEMLEKAIRFADKNCGRPKDGQFCGLMADYLIKTGVIVPPCKVGQTVYAYMGCGLLTAAIITRIETIETPGGCKKKYFAVGNDSPSVRFNDE